MDCEYEIVDRSADGQNILRCRRPECGRETVSAYRPEMVHTRCRAEGLPLAPTAAELIERVRRDLADRLCGELPAMLPEIARRVTICYDNTCKKFNERVCTDRGSACTCWKRWIERLAIGQCKYWIQDK